MHHARVFMVDIAFDVKKILSLRGTSKTDLEMIQTIWNERLVDGLAESNLELRHIHQCLEDDDFFVALSQFMLMDPLVERIMDEGYISICMVRSMIDGEIELMEKVSDDFLHQECYFSTDLLDLLHTNPFIPMKEPLVELDQSLFCNIHRAHLYPNRLVLKRLSSDFYHVVRPGMFLFFCKDIHHMRLYIRALFRHRKQKQNQE